MINTLANTRRTSLPFHGWVGGILVALFWFLNWTLPGLRTHWGFFGLWLGYCLLVDALVFLRKGHSLLTRNPKAYLAMFLVSVAGADAGAGATVVVDEQAVRPLHDLVEGVVLEDGGPAVRRHLDDLVAPGQPDRAVAGRGRTRDAQVVIQLPDRGPQPVGGVELEHVVVDELAPEAGHLEARHEAVAVARGRPPGPLPRMAAISICFSARAVALSRRLSATR